MSDSSSRRPLAELNQLIRENRVSEYSSPNLALGMSPVEFGAGTSRWAWSRQPPAALNPFGTVQGGYLTVFVDELFSTAVASVLEAGEWAVTAEFKIVFLRALSPGPLEGTGRVAPPQPLARFSRGSSGRRGRAGRGDRHFNLGRVAPPVKPRPQCPRATRTCKRSKERC